MQPDTPGQLPTPQPPASAPASSTSSLDYLNQISAPAVQKTISPTILWGAIGLGLLLLAVVVFGIFSSSGPSPTQQLTLYAQRIDAMKTLVDESQTKIQSTTLRRINSSLSLALATINKESADPLAKAGIKKLTKPTATSALGKEFATMTKLLEDARLNNAYDQAYAREVSYQIAQARLQIKALKKSASKSLQAVLESAESNLAPLNKQFASFNNSQG